MDDPLKDHPLEDEARTERLLRHGSYAQAALDASLKETISYALSRSLPKVPRRTAWRGVDPVHISIAAEAVIEHMRLCGFRIEKLPPLKMHRSS